MLKRHTHLVIDKNGEYGPFCTILNESEADRNQNLSTLDEKYFRGPDVSVVFMPGGNKRAMRLRLNFEWHTGIGSDRSLEKFMSRAVYINF